MATSDPRCPTSSDHADFFEGYSRLPRSIEGLNGAAEWPALRVLLTRTRAFRRADAAPLPLHPSIVFRGVTSLPAVLEPA